MTTWTNAVDGSDGTTVTAANSASYGDAFTSVGSTSGSSTMTYSTTRQAHGTSSMLVSFGSTPSGTYYAQWDLPSSVTDCYYRFYLNFDTLPPATMVLLDLLDSSGNRNCRFQMTTGGSIWFSDANRANNAAVTGALSANTTYRFEVHVHGDATAGTVDFYTYEGDSTTPLYTYNLTAENTRGNLYTAQYGVLLSVNGTGPYNYWFDDLGISDSGYLGPATTAVSGDAAEDLTVSVTATGSVTSSGGGGTFTPSGSGTALYLHNTVTSPLTTVNVGDLIVVIVTCHTDGTNYCTGISDSAGRVQWTQATSPHDGSNSNIPAGPAWTGLVWFGKVLSVGSTTVTFTYSGGAPTYTNAAGKMFTVSSGAWEVDTWTYLDSASGVSTWPSLTPAADGELYLGFAWNSASATSGSTSGYTYDASADTAGNGMAYNPSCAAGVATAPTWSDSSEDWGIMVLVRAVSSSVSGDCAAALTADVSASGSVAAGGGTAVSAAANVTAGGFTAVPGSVAAGLNADVTASGSVSRPGDSVAGLTFAVTAAGDTAGSLSGDVTVPLTVAATADGLAARTGGTAVPLTVAAVSSGETSVPGGTSQPLTVAVAAAGDISGQVTGDVVIPVIAGLTAAGTESGLGGAALDLATVAEAAGYVVRDGAVVIGEMLAVSAGGGGSLPGDAEVPLTAGVSADGLAGTPASPVAATVGLTATGSVETFAGAPVTVAAGLNAAGYTEAYGQAAAPLYVAVSAAGVSEPQYALLPHMQAGEPYSSWGAGEPSGQWNASKPSGQWAAGQPGG